MIFIISRNGDSATSDVVKWLKYYSVDFRRINFSDFFNNEIKLSLEITNQGRILRLRDEIYTEYDIANSVVWHRKTERFNDVDYSDSLKLSYRMYSHLAAEYDGLIASFFAMFNGARWLCEHKFIFLNKFDVLVKAQQCGLRIPATIISNRKEFISELCKSSTVTKCIANGISVRLDNINTYLLSTSKYSRKDYENTPEVFFPSTIQQNISKEYELRIFFIGNKFFTSAIFSQKFKSTRTDFRLGVAVGDRCKIIPYKLPIDVELKLLKLMRMIDLNTGSIDMIRTPQGEYCFLEVNPHGQYGWVASNCNYDISKEIAEYLINSH